MNNFFYPAKAVPCPKCGHKKPRVQRLYGQFGLWCENCHHEECRLERTPEEAVTAWNKYASSITESVR